MFGLLVKLIAWRLQVRDVSRYNDRLEKANTDVRAQLKLPPAIPDVLSKIIIVVMILGLAAWAAFPVYRLGLGISHAAKVKTTDPTTDRNCAADCTGLGCGCANGQCKCTAIVPSQARPAAGTTTAQKPISDSLPAKYMDTRPEAFPDRPRGTYSAAGGVFRY